MEEILYRGKRLDNGEWVYGYYAKLPHPITTFLEDYIIVVTFDSINEIGDVEYVLVDPETVGIQAGHKWYKREKPVEINNITIDIDDTPSSKTMGKTIIKQAQYSLKNLKEYFTFLVDSDFDFVESDHTQFTSEQLDIIGLALEKANKLQEDKDYIINQYKILTRYRKQLHEADLGEGFMSEKEYEMLYQTVQDIEELIQKEMEKQYE